MAEAFIEADERTIRPREDIVHAEEPTNLPIGLAKQTKAIDDVSAVLDNLDEYLNSWDLDVELSKARADAERESWAVERPKGLDQGPFAGFEEAGVWD
jgi:hypothetical protein